MPQICMNLDGLEWNAQQVLRLCRDWGVSYLPVLKMVAGHPQVVHLLADCGFSAFGYADIDEPAMFDTPALAHAVDKVLINLPPPRRAADVARIFRRAVISDVEGTRAMDAALAGETMREPLAVLLMIDLGDAREGVPAREAAALAEKIRHAAFQRVRVAGLGVTMGCLRGACPDEENMALLAKTANDVQAALGSPLEVVSLGGSIFFNWFAEHRSVQGLPQGCGTEFRAGDPLLLGYDMYRDQPFPVPGFRSDLFTLEATVVEMREKPVEPPRISANNGQGRPSPSTHTAGRGIRRRALLDCGILHTDVRGLDLDLPGATIVDFSGNYSILDVTECPVPPAVGDTVVFHPRYWAVARAFRSPTVSKCFVRANGPAAR